MDVAGESIPPIRTVVAVGWSPEDAFERFTSQLGRWWPLATHSVGQDKADSVIFQGRVGGELIETWHDGTRSVWGTVVEWDPPRFVSFTWHPGRDPEGAQRLAVTFTPDGGGGTRVQLVHSGWETLGADAVEMRAGYVSGWAGVLGLYAGPGA